MRCFPIACCVLLVAALAVMPPGARADEGAGGDTAAVLRALPEPSASRGFYVRGSQRLSQAGRTVSMPATLTAFPTRESGQAAWSVRQEVRRRPMSSVEEALLARDLQPLRGSARGEQGDKKQSLTWRLEEGRLVYVLTDPSGKTREGAEPAHGPVLLAGAGIVLFMRQLRPRTGSFRFLLLAPDLLVQVGLVPMTLEVTKQPHEGKDAYVGRAELPGAMSILVVLDAETGGLRALETRFVRAQAVAELLEIRDLGTAEVHNQTAAALEQAGDLDAALAEAQAAQAAEKDESAYPLRMGAIHRKLAAAAEGQERLRHKMLAGLLTMQAADLVGEGLRSGRLSKEDAGAFRAMQAVLDEQAGNELLEVLAADPKALRLHGKERSFLEVRAARALVRAARASEGPERKPTLELAGRIASRFALQNATRLDKASRELASLAALAWRDLAALRPRDAQLWQDIGRMHYAAVEDGEAIAALEASLEVRPKSPTARVYYGAALWRTGRLADARKQLAILDRVGARAEARTLRALTGM